MSVEYDLVIVGGEPAGVYAAAMSARLKARVALVSNAAATPLQQRWLAQTVLRSALKYLGATAQARRQSALPQRQGQDGVWPLEEAIAQRAIALSGVQPWVEAIAENWSAQFSPEVLAALGVDVVIGAGQFYRKPRLGLTLNDRQLRARSYLIAPDIQPLIPPVDGLEAVQVLTPESLLTAGLSATSQPQPNDAIQTPILCQTLPQTLIILGDDAIGVELAQALARLGVQVTLVISSAQILPHADAETAFLLQAQLEADGVRVLTRLQATHVKELQGQTWVQVDNRANDGCRPCAIAADGLLLATSPQPNVSLLNLEAAGIRWQPSGILHNAKLQTTNPQVYVCQGGYGKMVTDTAAIAQYEAEIALKNALFFPLHSVHYQTIPIALCTEPELAQVGVTEQQAYDRYGRDVVVVRQPFNALLNAQVQGATTGFCKLIVRQSGQLIGAHVIGAKAGELIGTIALAMQHQITIADLAKLVLPSSTFAEVITQTARAWQQHRLDQNTVQQELLENFFSLRRSMTR